MFLLRKKPPTLLPADTPKPNEKIPFVSFKFAARTFPGGFPVLLIS